VSIAQQAPACRLEFSKKEGLYANILPESYGANEFAMLKNVVVQHACHEHSVRSIRFQA